MIDTDSLRYHTVVGTGRSKQAMLNLAADEIERLRFEADITTKMYEEKIDALKDFLSMHGFIFSI